MATPYHHPLNSTNQLCFASAWHLKRSIYIAGTLGECAVPMAGNQYVLPHWFYDTPPFPSALSSLYVSGLSLHSLHPISDFPLWWSAASALRWAASCSASLLFPLGDFFHPLSFSSPPLLTSCYPSPLGWGTHPQLHVAEVWGQFWFCTLGLFTLFTWIICGSLEILVWLLSGTLPSHFFLVTS